MEDAHFLISENKTQNLLVLDLYEQLGVVTTSMRSEPAHLLEDISQDPISENWGS